MKRLKSTPCRHAGPRKKRGVLQTALLIPVAEKLSPPKKQKNAHPPPPDPDKFISPSQVPNFVGNPLDEAWHHNANVVRRGIAQRQQNKISNLSTTPHSTCNKDADEYEQDFIDDSAAVATTLT